MVKGIQHKLVPEHTKLKEKERKDLLDDLNTDFKNLPRISRKDPAIAHLEVKPGDVIKIIRESATAGKAVFYRGVG